jgi:hypothetical protein
MMPKDDDRVKRLAVDICERILSGVVSPYEGSRQIWQEVTTQTSSDEIWDVLAGFIGEATEWQDHPEAASEIERDIRSKANAVVELWGSEGPKSSA